jgi:hypothetical protein
LDKIKKIFVKDETSTVPKTGHPSTAKAASNMKAAEILQTFNSYSSFVKHGLTPKDSSNQGAKSKAKTSLFN